jgi:hypothetical protein
MEEAVRAGPARKWLPVLIAVGIVLLVVFLLAVPGCGSGSSGIGRL